MDHASCSAACNSATPPPLPPPQEEEGSQSLLLLERSKSTWDDLSDWWDGWIGEEGDVNRRTSSDPILWSLAGNLEGLTVLDAGCGNGYLSLQLLNPKHGVKKVEAVDLSPKLVKIAQERLNASAATDRISIREDSITSLSTVESSSIDIILSNYVVQDSPCLPSICEAFHRVLKPGGRAVLVFLHPCFCSSHLVSTVPSPSSSSAATTATTPYERVYRWSNDHPYLCEETVFEVTWAGLKKDKSITTFHRPLSVYFREFQRVGFQILHLKEPPFYNALYASDVCFSIIFHLQKPS
ncbi:methyltransferase [Balamuthia mandrillaris]